MATAKLRGVVEPSIGAKAGNALGGWWAEPGLELGQHLIPDQHSWGVSVPISRDRRVDPQVVAWDVTERVDPTSATDVVCRA